MRKLIQHYGMMWRNEYRLYGYPQYSGVTIIVEDTGSHHLAAHVKARTFAELKGVAEEDYELHHRGRKIYSMGYRGRTVDKALTEAGLEALVVSWSLEV